MIPIIFFIPLMQLLVLSFAVTFEIKVIKLDITDNDNTITSRRLISHFRASSFYQVSSSGNDSHDGLKMLQKGDAHQVLIILPGFEKALTLSQPSKVQIVTDAINGSAAALMNVYTVSIINEFNREILKEMFPGAGLPVNLTSSFWFNPELDYKTYMVPGILVLLVTIIGMFLSGMNIVREKELGTIEQINVTPIKKHQFIAGKLIPFWIIALFELAFGLVLARLVFDIPILGNIFLIFLVASVYLLVIMGLGVFVSTVTHNQQQAMFMAWFVLVIFILMSGIFTPVESMPTWAHNLNLLNPIAYFINIIRMIMLKGSEIQNIIGSLLILAGYGILMLSLSVWRYRKTV